MSEQNRATFPATAKLVDELRAQGFDPKVIWCREHGQERGKRPQYAGVFDIPANYRKPAGGWK